MLGINLYLEMVCYAFCRRRPVQEGNGDGDGQCKFDGEKKKFGEIFFFCLGILVPRYGWGRLNPVLANRHLCSATPPPQHKIN